MHLNIFLTDCNGSSAAILSKQYENIKDNLVNILQTTDFCGICLENRVNLFHVSELMKLDLPTSSSMEVMMNELFGEMVQNNIPSKYVCDRCVHNIRQSYNFINKVKTSYLILTSYLNQMESQIGEIENMIQTSDTHNFANTIIVLQNLITLKSDKDNNETEIRMVHQQTNSEDNCSDIDSDDSSSLQVSLELDNIYFQCQICDAKFQTLLLYMQHCNEDHSNETACFECIGQCVHEKYLQHIEKQILEGSKLLKCLDCNFSCLKKQSLVGHINKDHLKYFPYPCEFCCQVFHSLIAHQNHVASSHKDTLKCEHCGLRCNDSSHKTKHVAKCKFQPRKYQCYECKVYFSTYDDINNHTETAHGHTKTCMKCLKKFPNKKVLEKHIINMHKGMQTDTKKPRPCSVCPAILYSLSDLKRHLKTHDPCEKHKCHVCNKEFQSRKMYNVHRSSYSHLRKADPGLKTKFNFECPHCDFTCKNNFMMENHKNTNHLKVKPHACTICNKAFTTSINLRYHMERHKGIRRFQCSECSSMFTAASGLKKHCLRYHSEQRPVACDMCEKSFVCQSEYSLHKLRYHSEKNVLCPLCDSKFHSLSNLRAHLKKVHMKGQDLDDYMKSGDASEQLYELMRDHRFLF